MTKIVVPCSNSTSREADGGSESIISRGISRLDKALTLFVVTI